jgi:CHAD domain-containing protein
LQFFEPVLGPTAWTTIATVKQLQEHLGALNDARIALSLLAETEGDELLATAVVHYRAAQEQEVARLVAGFAPLWQAFEQPAWRQQLATAVAAL